MLDTHDAQLLCEAVDLFTRSRILVVGDVMMDEFIWGRVERISPEAPVPVVEVESRDLMLGGAGNVARNIIHLGGQAILCGVIGKDAMGEEIERRLHKMSSPSYGLVLDNTRPTTLKTRVVSRPQNVHVVRVDHEDQRPVAEDTLQKILTTLKKELDSVDAVIVTDFGKGVVTESLMDGIRSLTHDRKIILAVDPKEQHLALYRNVTLITPNKREAKLMSGIKIEDEESVKQAGNYLLRELNCRMVLITQGEKGMTLFEQNGKNTLIPTVAQKVFDVSGAGDTVISTFTLALAAGLKPKEAAVLANFAAGIVVAEVGTATVQASRLKETLLFGIPGRD